MVMIIIISVIIVRIIISIILFLRKRSLSRIMPRKSLP